MSGELTPGVPTTPLTYHLRYEGGPRNREMRIIGRDERRTVPSVLQCEQGVYQLTRKDGWRLVYIWQAAD